MAGLVGVGGSTANVLMSNLKRMRILIDRSLTEVRMRSDSDLDIQPFRLADLFDQIVTTASMDAKKRQLTLVVEIEKDIVIEADRQLLLSAVANLVQNAIKYSNTGTEVFLRGKKLSDRITTEVQDHCGGINVDKISSLFKPYVQNHADRSGLGLGLSIAQKAVHLIQGRIQVENHPGVGCTFTVDVPLKLAPASSNKSAVPGKDSVQPGFGEKTHPKK